MKIGIIGLGLITGSIAKSIKKNIVDVEIIGTDIREDMLIKALNENIISEYTLEINERYSDCNIIFIGTPVNYVVEYVKKLEKFITKDTIITDVGSTKFKICKELEHNKNVSFIGGHPMAGSEKNSYEFSKDNMFQNATYILTPFSHTDSNQLEILKNLVNAIGGKTLQISYEDHDKYVASISHLPQIIATSLVNYVKNNDVESQILHTLCAGGFKDITRIASTDGVLWDSIIMNNRDNVVTNINKYIEELEKVKDMLTSYNDTSPKLVEYINSGKEYRDSF